MNDIFTILNYQGSKKRLLKFINENIVDYIDESKAILDICCGTSSIAYSLKSEYKVYANDSEVYAAIIARALLQNNDKNLWKEIKQKFETSYIKNYQDLNCIYKKFLLLEEEAVLKEDYQELAMIYEVFPTIWSGKKFNHYNNKINNIDDLKKHKDEIPYMLFTTYYSTTYFGIKQSMEIDSLRYAIEMIKNESMKCVLLSSLYYGMKECVFSKDGHMAQPLDIKTNKGKLVKIRKKSVYSEFMNKLNEFYSDKFVVTQRENKVFNMEMERLLKDKELKKEIGFIYADPPYTDMQYSRYYHLLSTVTLYDYDKISLNRGAISKGLYRETRFQSPLSQKSKAKEQIIMLFKYCKDNEINLGLSFAYPRNPQRQAVNRYTMRIEDIIELAQSLFGMGNVKVKTEEYEHSNNRNSDSKKVLEYLILCRSRENNYE